MRPWRVKERHIFLDYSIQLPVAQGEHVVQTFPPYAPQKPLQIALPRGA